MTSVSKQISQLSDFLADDFPNFKGEYRLHCPFHEDTRPSAHVNFEKGFWHCKPCDKGGTVASLIQTLRKESLQTSKGKSKITNISEARSRRGDPDAERISMGAVEGWHAALESDPNHLSEMRETRGITFETIKKYKIGYDQSHNAFTIPILDGQEVLNVRRYRPNPHGKEKKIWNIEGMGTARLYPLDSLKNSDPIIICEGEMDALITIQNGFSAISSTSGAGHWDPQWGVLFTDRQVYICYDNDSAGRKGARKAAGNVLNHAKEVYLVSLPIEEKGADLTDYFFNEGMGKDDFQRLLDEATPFGAPPFPSADIQPISVLDSFDAKLSGKKLSMVVTVIGKKNPSYNVPALIHYQCDMQAGERCNTCPMLAREGDYQFSVEKNNPEILKMIDIPDKQLQDQLRELIDAVKCNRLSKTKLAQQNVENLFVIGSVDHVEKGQKADYVDRRILNVGKHDTSPNSTVKITGTILPNPKNQLAEFLSWDMEPMESTIDTFQITDDIVKELEIFQVSPGQRPLSKMEDIATDLSNNVTKIYDRNDMHIAMDLVFHSVINFDFAGQQVDKGWLELLLIGDTRTGKSESALRMQEHYGVGRMVSCESASFAGIVGGLTQTASTNEWTVRWGAIPINDRRLVILDEVSGLSTEEISQLSSIRSSGIAQLTKINQQQTYARTRLIWISNPRRGNLGDYTFGMKAVEQLIGNPEDIARFDFAISVASHEVSIDTINMMHDQTNNPKYPSEICNKLILWAWSRKKEDIVWTVGAEEVVLLWARKLGDRYLDDPPLIQAANIRVKVARLAVAMAARVFSTDKTHTKVVVKKAHVVDAVKFLDSLYKKSSFGYYSTSLEMIRDREIAVQSSKEVKKYLKERDGMGRFLRQHNSFRLTDLIEMRNMQKDEAQLIIEYLSEKRMIIKRQAQIVVLPVLNEILREMEE